MNKLLKYLSLLFFQFLWVNFTIGQIDTINRRNDIQQYHSFIDYSLEFYWNQNTTLGFEHNLNYQPFINDKNIVNVEALFMHHVTDSSNYFTPGDFSISYQRNIITKKMIFKQDGFQGAIGRLKMVIPTGKSQFESGGDSWAAEPLMGVQWFFAKRKFLVAFVGRYRWNYASNPHAQLANDFFRLETVIGYENNKMYAYLESDYRYFPRVGGHVVFLKLDLGYRVNQRIGLYLRFKPRVYGEMLYRLNSSFGLYIYL